jgi:hypothetical protein
VGLRGAQQIPAKRTARLERDAEADLETVRRFEGGDQAGLVLGAFDRPFAESEDIAGILVPLPGRLSGFHCEILPLRYHRPSDAQSTRYI